jgi:hypothetical protein
MHDPDAESLRQGGLDLRIAIGRRVEFIRMCVIHSANMADRRRICKFELNTDYCNLSIDMFGSGLHQIYMEPMTDQFDLAGDLLRGAAAIAQEIFGTSSRKAQRKVYHLQSQLPVFQLDEDGTLYAFRSRLRDHFEARSLEKEQRIAAAAIVKPAVKTTPFRPRRRSQSVARAGR